MADLSLKIKADFDEAKRQYDSIADAQNLATASQKKFAESFQGEQIDKFTNKTKLYGAAVTATSGDVAGLTAQQNAYKREIERLIKAGLDPQSDAVRRLAVEYDRLGKELTDSKNKTALAEQGMKSIKTAALASVAALTAATVATAAMIQKSAEVGDAAAKTSRIIGMSAEAWQEYAYAAEMSGISSETLKGSLQKLNKNVSDLKDGSGTLTAYLKDNDKALLAQLQTVKSNEEAFDLMLSAINKAPDEFTRAALAQAAFGKSGQDLILLANEGADGIDALREAARKYGVVSNEAAKQSEAYLDAQANVKQALAGVTNQLAEALMPTMTEGLQKVADFISGFDNIKGILEVLIPVLAGAAAGLTAFLLVANAGAIIGALVKAFQALNAVVMANPLAAIAGIVVAVLIPAIMLLIKNWDMVVLVFQNTINALSTQFQIFGSKIAEALTVGFNSAKIAVLSLAQAIYVNVLNGIAKLLEVMGKLPLVGEMFDNASAAVKGMANSLDGAIVAAKNESAAAIKASKDKQDALELELTKKREAFKQESEARKELLRQQQESNTEEIAQTQAKEAAITEVMVLSLTERLDALAQTEAMKENERLTTFGQFLQARADAEGVYGEQRIEFFRQELERIQALETLSNEERASAAKSVNKAIVDTETKTAADKAAVKKKELQTYATFFGSMSSLMQQAAGENKAAAVGVKIASAAQAGINSYLAFTQMLADPFYTGRPWMRVIAGASILAQGLAAQASIWSTPIGAETGGRFTVPDVSGGPDGAIMRVNPGETVDVNPRSGTTTDGQMQNITVQLENQVLFTAINRGIKSGDIIINARNIQGATA